MRSLLYERTGLSADKKGLILDTDKKADQGTPEVIMRDPYVFEFVGLDPKEEFAEINLVPDSIPPRCAMIDSLFIKRSVSCTCPEVRSLLIHAKG